VAVKPLTSFPFGPRSMNTPCGIAQGFLGPRIQASRRRGELVLEPSRQILNRMSDKLGNLQPSHSGQ